MTAEDDATALAIFQRCEVSVAFTLDMLTFALIGDFDVDPSATTVPVATMPVATVPAGLGRRRRRCRSPRTTHSSTSSSRCSCRSRGSRSTTRRPRACSARSAPAVRSTPTDTAALLQLLDACGITLSDLVPSYAKVLAGPLAR